MRDKSELSVQDPPSLSTHIYATVMGLWVTTQRRNITNCFNNIIGPGMAEGAGTAKLHYSPGCSETEGDNTSENRANLFPSRQSRSRAAGRRGVYRRPLLSSRGWMLKEVKPLKSANRTSLLLTASPIMRRLCWVMALTALCSGCTTALEENVCQPNGAASGSQAYLQQCRMSNDQLQMLLSRPTAVPYTLPSP